MTCAHTLIKRVYNPLTDPHPHPHTHTHTQRQTSHRYVAESGPAFADGVRRTRGNDPKFAFLNPSHPHHAYYTDRVRQAQLGAGVNPAAGTTTAATPNPSTAATTAGGTPTNTPSSGVSSVETSTVTSTSGKNDVAATSANADVHHRAQSDATSVDSAPAAGGWVGWKEASTSPPTAPKRSRFGQSPAEAAADARTAAAAAAAAAGGGAAAGQGGKRGGVVVERVRVVVSIEDPKKKERRERAKAFAEKLKMTKAAESEANGSSTNISTGTAPDADSRARDASDVRGTAGANNGAVSDDELGT